MSESLAARRALLESRILAKLRDPVRYSVELKVSLRDPYRLREGARPRGEMRVNQGQEFVIGGYTPNDRNFDALIIGYYERGKLFYAGCTRNGFTPPLRWNS
jgi:hypothetical protein